MTTKEKLTYMTPSHEDRARLVNLLLALESSGASRILDALDVAASTGDETAIETHKLMRRLAVRHNLHSL